jgi:hypothetical protein
MDFGMDSSHFSKWAQRDSMAAARPAPRLGLNKDSDNPIPRQMPPLGMNRNLGSFVANFTIQGNAKIQIEKMHRYKHLSLAQFRAEQNKKLCERLPLLFASVVSLR